MAEKKFLDYDGLVYLLKGLPKYRIRVTYAEEFKGKISTCKRVDGTGNPYTKPIPSSAPYVLTFVVDGPGKWEISCDESTAIVDVTELKTYEIQLNSFDFKQWMIAGDIKNNPFATLDELLDDEKSIRQLITKHSSVDYMVNWFKVKTDDANIILNNRNVIKWINLRDYALDKLEEVPAIKTIMDNVGLYGYGEVGYDRLVPFLASNVENLVSGGAYSSYYAYLPFDGTRDLTTPTHRFLTLDGSKDYIGYNFNKPVCPVRFEYGYNVDGTGQRASAFDIQGSNDGTNWTTIASFEELLDFGIIKSHDIECNASYRYLRFKRTALEQTSSFSIGYLQFYSFEPLGLVPDMTSDTTPYGSAIGSTIYKGYNPCRAFAGKSKPLYATLSDNDPNCWAVSGKNGFIGYKFVKPTEVTKLIYIPRWEEGNNVYKQSPKVWNFEYSDDGNTWSSVKTFTETPTTSPEIRIREINAKPGYHIYWRMNVTENLGESFTAIARLQFYGRQLTDLIPAMDGAECSRGKLTGKVSSPAGAASTNIWTLFDKKIDTNSARNYCTFDPNGHEWFQFEFANPTKVKMMMITANFDHTSYATDYKFSISTSSNGNNYDIVSSNITANTNNKYPVLDIQNNNFENKFWRIDFDYCSKQNGLSELTFFGPDYSEHEFGDDNFLQIYDHGVEITPISYKASSGSIIKSSDRIEILAQASGNGYENQRTIWTDDIIDFSKHSVIRATSTDHIGLYHTNSSMYGECYGLGCSKTKPNSGNNQTDVNNAAAIVATVVPYAYDTCVDVSSKVEALYPAIYNGYWYGIRVSIKEWWLE